MNIGLPIFVLAGLGVQVMASDLVPDAVSSLFAAPVVETTLTVSAATDPFLVDGFRRVDQAVFDRISYLPLPEPCMQRIVADLPLFAGAEAPVLPSGTTIEASAVLADAAMPVMFAFR